MSQNPIFNRATNIIKFVCIDYWNIHAPVKPVKIVPPENWDGTVITPISTEKVIPTTEEYEDIIISPINEETKSKGTITRAFGDILCDEVI